MKYLPGYKRIFAFLGILLLPALACNFPGLAPPGSESLSAAEMRATLQAQRGALEASPQPETSGGASFGPPFAGLQTATAGPPQPAATPEPLPGYYTYITQSGDTLAALALRFASDPAEIISPEPLPPLGYLPVGLPLGIPDTLEQPPYPSAVLPDSEIVYSPSTLGFDVAAYVQQANGFLSSYSETIDGAPYSGAQIVSKVAAETSTNPRLLLAFLEYRAGWVLGSRPVNTDRAYPLGFRAPGYKGFYRELVVLASQLNVGYYGWRQGTLTSFDFKDGRSVRMHPALNAGSVALQRLFAQFYTEAEWGEILYGAQEFIVLHNQMFGDPWARAAQVEPLLYAGAEQPSIALPFRPGERWSFSGGPHASWGVSTPYGAIDFSPVTGQSACEISRAWAAAAADGVVARSMHGALALDLDGDGNEGTGWVLVYLHLSDQERLPAGSVVTQDTPLGHPSCERGSATGSHVHLARKFNGEWLPAAGPAPFTLSGWLVVPGEKAYKGELVRDGEVVIANPGGPRSSTLVR